jgi:hypothetical protein
MFEPHSARLRRTRAPHHLMPAVQPRRIHARLTDSPSHHLMRCDRTADAASTRANRVDSLRATHFFGAAVPKSCN